MLMASLQIEVASSSSPFSYSLRDHNPRSTNIKGYIHSQCIRKNKADDDKNNDCDSSWLPSQNSKARDDDSWLPAAASRTSTVGSESDRFGHRKGHNEVDNSWLPATNDAEGKCQANSHEYENDIDYSWLPSTFTDNHQKKHKHDNINDKNKNKNKSKYKNNDNEEKEKIRVVDIINKLSREEEITASGAGGNVNESKLEEKRHKRCVSKTLESNNRLDVMDLRERFNSGVEKGATNEVDYKTKTKTNTTSSINITNKKEEEEDTDKKQAFESFEDWMTNEYSQTHNDMDEDESYDMQPFDGNYDWIGDISRPKSDWEGMRQARYQEMLNRSSGSADIRRLLERKNVSGFLSSGLRDLIDQIITSRIQKSYVEVENQEVVVSEKAESRKEDVLQEDGSMEDEFGDCRSTNDNDRPCSEYCETPYSERSWIPNDGVYSFKTATTTTTTTTTTSPSLDRSLSSNRSRNNSTPQSSSGVAHRSIEMELAYDLRGHMEQLHQEIIELRRSIKCCVNMQIKMHHSYKQNAAIDQATRSATVSKKDKKRLGAGRNYCFICDEKQVDSLLYRCGHMCTCFICGIELQRTSGECPICEASIMDVVNTFAREN